MGSGSHLSKTMTLQRFPSDQRFFQECRPSGRLFCGHAEVHMKPCIKCGVEKPLSEFYAHPQMKGGRLNKCKECTKKGVRDNRARRAKQYQEYEKNRAMLPHRVALRERYQSTTAGKQALRRAKTKFRENNPIKAQAHQRVKNAIAAGRLCRPCVCDECKRPCHPHAHHDDYLRQLEVRWLCSECHRAWHKVNGEAKNSNARPLALKGGGRHAHAV